MAIEIGQSLRRVDARQKVLGQEKYAADLFQPGMLLLRLLEPDLKNGLH